jgi:hypothetical protein
MTVGVVALTKTRTVVGKLNSQRHVFQHGQPDNRSFFSLTNDITGFTNACHDDPEP